MVVCLWHPMLLWLCRLARRARLDHISRGSIVWILHESEQDLCFVGKGALQGASWFCAAGWVAGLEAVMSVRLISYCGGFAFVFVVCFVVSSSLSGGFGDNGSWQQRVAEYMAFVQHDCSCVWFCVLRQGEGKWNTIVWTQCSCSGRP